MIKRLLELCILPFYGFADNLYYLWHNREIDDKFRAAVSASIHRVLARQGSQETYTFEEIEKALPGRHGIRGLRNWLTWSWEPGMCFENFGTYWDIDHTVPQSVYPYQTIYCDNFQRAWDWKNLKPATKADIVSRATHKKTFFFDIDGTILSSPPNHEYAKAQPFPERIKKVNALYEAGHTVILYTARGSITNANHRDFTVKQLWDAGVRFTEVFTTKPHYDIWVDDRAASDVEFFTNPKVSDRFPFLKDI